MRGIKLGIMAFLNDNPGACKPDWWIVPATPKPVVEADDECLLDGFISRFRGNSVTLLMKESPLT